MSNQMIIERAKSAEMSHDYATAARIYKELLLRDTTNVEYLYALGRIYVNSGEDKKAIPYFEQIHSFHPDNVQSMTALGGIFRRLGRYEASTAILYKALETGKDKLNVYYNLGFTLKEMKNYEDAVDAFENVIAINPRDVLTHNHLGSIYLETNELDKAVNAYKRGLQIDPNHPILNYNLARTYTKLKNYPDAVRCYENALKTRPNWPEAITNFSSLLIKCQKSEEAARIVKQSIKIHPNDPELLYSLGQVYLHQFDYDNAKKTLKRASSVKANDVKILTALSAAYEKADESEKALDTILTAIDLEPLNNDVRMQYVDTLLSVSDYNSAFETIESMDSDTNGKDVKVMDLYGQYYITQGEDEKAEQYYDKIKKTDHHYKEYMLGASKRYTQIEKYEDAERYARDFVKNRASRPEGYNMLGKIYTKSGRYEEAKLAYEQGSRVRVPNVFAKKGIENAIRLQAIPVEGLAPVENETGVIPEEKIAVQNETELKNDEILDEDFDFASLGEDEDLAEPADEMTSIADQLEDEGFDIFDEIDEDEADPEALATDELLDAIQIADSLEPENTLKAEGNEEFEDAVEIPAEEEAEESAEPEKTEEVFDAAKTAQQAMQLALDAENRVKEMESRQKMQEPAYNNAAEPAEDFAPEAPAPAPEMPESETETAGPEIETAAFEPEEAPSANDSEIASFDDDDAELEIAEEEPEDSLSEDEKLAEEEFDDFFGEEDDSPVDDSEFAKAPEDNSNFDDDFDAELEENLDTTPFTNVIELYAELLAIYGDIDDEDSEAQLIDLSEKIQSGEISAEETDDTGIEEKDFTAPEEAPATGTGEVQRVEEVSEMLAKIEAILSDDELALKYSKEISMLKRLKTLCEYLPNEEKIAFASGRIRMLMDYLLSKMSGKPGLLLTTQSLLKSGVLGNEYRVQLISECEDELNNELVRRVLVYMKKLSESLEDFGLAAALRACADGALEKIEMEDQKSEIF